MMNRINEPAKYVRGMILISSAFKPSIHAGAGPLGAYRRKRKELITSHPKVAAPTTKNPSLLPRFVAFKTKVEPKKESMKNINKTIPVHVRLDDKSVLIISRIRCHSSQIIYY